MQEICSINMRTACWDDTVSNSFGLFSGISFGIIYTFEIIIKVGCRNKRRFFVDSCIFFT